MTDLGSDQTRPEDGLFQQSVQPGGYAWWYADAISEDGQFALTMIAFIGSVFSPYYAWSGRHRPLNHCALNIALYGPRHNRWTMTERGQKKISQSADHFRIGPSHLSWDGSSLDVQVCETGMPLPYPVRGHVRIRPRYLNQTRYHLDPEKRHFWRPVAPLADIEMAFSQPALKWRGTGYFDMNSGETPLEDTFRYWDWSRTHQNDGTTRISYSADTRAGTQVRHALRFLPDGTCEPDGELSERELPSTPVFRIHRRINTPPDTTVRLEKTLEDTPFYSRSRISTLSAGEWAQGVHESFDGNRLSSPVTRLMLPFRMPRRA